MTAPFGRNNPFHLNIFLRLGKDVIKEVITHIEIRCNKNGTPIRVFGAVKDISHRQQFNDAIQNIAAGVSAQTGEIFFSKLVKQLSRLFDATYAFIALIDDENPTQVHTLTVYAHGEIVPNMIYSLAGTPCANVVGQKTCAYPDKVQSLFPEDTLLTEMGAVSYIGTPLFNTQ